MFERFRVGVHLVRIACDSYGTDRFWDAIGWWHGEVHYTIPRLEEEKRVAAELELAFTDTGEGLPFSGQVMTSAGCNIQVPTSVSTRIADPSIRFGDQTVVFKDGRITLDSDPGCVGEWRWQGIAVRTKGRPARARRLLLGVLLGAEWVPDNGIKKAQVSLGPEYDRLADSLSGQ